MYGTIHKYLGMIIDGSKDDRVEFTIDNFFEDTLKETSSKFYLGTDLKMHAQLCVLFLR